MTVNGTMTLDGSPPVEKSESWSTLVPPDNVIQFPYQPGTINPGEKYSRPTQSDITGYNSRGLARPRYRQHSFEKVPHRIKSEDFMRLLDQSFMSIVDALDGELSTVERSNRFDDWKYEIKDISQSSKSLDIRQRKVLGALIASSLRRDLPDFTTLQLELFRDATNLVRQPMITKKDSKSMLSRMRKNGLKMRLSLSVDGLSEDALKKIDAYMDNLLSHE